MKRSTCVFCALALLILFLAPLSNADVPSPPAPPPAPGGYCSTIYSELQTGLQAFNQLLTVPPTWNPVPGDPPIYAGNLQTADSNAGPAIAGPNHLSGIYAQLNEEKAMGVQAIELQIGFPVLYAPFQGGDTQLQPYLTFYKQVAQAVKALGMKLIVENDVLLANDMQSGWPNLASYFKTLSWDQYIQARAAMAVTIAENMQPDFLILAEEPDTEASQSGQLNLNNATYAAQMVSAEIAAVRASSFPNSKLGAGFGAWPQANGTSIADFIAAYIALPLDYIDSHIYPINTVSGGTGSLIGNILTIASGAAAAGKPVALSEAWLWKMENSEWNVLSADFYRGREPFSFWAPLDAYFLQTMQALANYANMVFVAPDGPDYLFTYQTYGGTTENGGAANCTCTTTYCGSGDIIQTETQLAKTANNSAVFSTSGLSFSSQLVTSPDTVAPSDPAGLTASAGYTSANLSWTASTDNVGVAGYNVSRCSPPALGQPCTGVWIANATTTSYSDSTLTQGTPYNYQVQAFDLANNLSGLSQTVSLQTYRISPLAPSNLILTAVSPTGIDLSWSPPQNSSGLSEYLIYSGTSSNVQQIASVSGSTTTYHNRSLNPSTNYYYGVVAVENGSNSPMSPLAWISTLPLPAPPSQVVATASSTTEVVLNWQQTTAGGSLPVVKFQIWEGTASGMLTHVGTTATTTYTRQNLTPYTTYYYQIVAVDGHGDRSLPSNQVSVVTSPPPAPANLAATTPSITQISLTWSWAPAPGGLPISQYLVYCGTSPANLVQVATTIGNSFNYRTVSPNTQYYFYVVAVDTGGNYSPNSPVIAATTPAVPNAPTSVTAVAILATQVSLKWTEALPPNGLPIQYYMISRGPSPGNLTQVALSSGPSFTDRTVSPSTTYYYAIQAKDADNDVSPMSVTVQTTTPPLPNAPTGVTAAADSATQVSVTWSDTIPSNGLPIQYFLISRGLSLDSLVQVALSSGPSFTDRTVSGATTYYYAIQAKDSGGEVSPLSATVQTTTPPLPNAPTGVTAVANSSTRVTLSWTETIPPNGLPIQCYIVLRGLTPAGLTQVALKTASPFTDTSVSAGTTYYYAIQAKDTGGGLSPLSGTVQTTTP